jgi:hypothetical protein
MINQDNWTHCRFKSENLFAFITFGASPEGLDSEKFEYYVTVLENEDTEIFQQQFDSLIKACIFINREYRSWEFEDLTIKKSGCSTCVAH